MLGKMTLSLGKKRIAANSHYRCLEMKPSKQSGNVPKNVEVEALVRNFQRGETDQVVTAARAMVARHPQFAFGWKLLAAALDASGQAKDALLAMSTAAGLAKEDAEIFSNLCVMLRRAGQLAEARAAGVRAITLRPDLTQAHFNLAVVLQDQGELREAEERYRLVLEMTPSHGNAWNNLGALLEKAGRYEEGEACFCEALRLNPQDAIASHGLGNIHFEQHRFDDAIACYRQATVAAPGFFSAWFNLGVSLAKRDRHEEASASLKRALTLNGSDARAHYNMATCLLEMDDLPGAEAAYTLAIAHGETKPVAAEATIYLAVLRYLDGDLVRARTLLSAIPHAPTDTGDGLSDAARAYRLLLDRLLVLDWLEQPAPPLYVIGESHSLSLHRATVDINGVRLRCEAQWIWGCKQYHLSNPGANKFKAKFSSCIARIPAGSQVLFLIGEIDCRPNEGILAAWRKSGPRSIDEITRETTASYVSYVLAAVEKQGLRPIFAGVPAITRNINDPEGDLLRQRVVRTMNSCLFNLAQENACGFLDLYSLTSGSDEYSNGRWNIDPIHLTPTAYAEAFAHFLHIQK